MATKNAKAGKKSSASKGDIKAKLARFKKNWENSKKAASQSEWDYPGPDGPVVGVVKSAEFDANVWGKGELGVRIKCECAGGKYKGKPLPAITRSLENDDAIVWLQRDLQRFGCDIDELDVESLEETLKEIVGTYFMGRVKTGENGYQNLNVSKAIDEDDVKDATPDDDEDEDEESEEEGEEEESEEEEEEEEKPSKSKKSAKAKKSKKDEDEDADEDGGEDEDEDEEESDEDAEEDAEEDDGEDEDEEAEEAELDIGAKVAWKDGKKEMTGVVKKINEKKGTVEIMPKGSKTAVTVKVDKLELLA